jgi:hypothetical protein
VVEFPHQPFSIDEVISPQLVSFVQFHVESTDLSAVHVAVGANRDIFKLSLKFEEMATNSNKLIRRPLPEPVKYLTNIQD